MGLSLKVISLSVKTNRETSQRSVTSVYGMPFYCSSGLGSGYPGTWFPFLGISRVGYFILPPAADDTLPQAFYEIFVPKTYLDRNKVDLPHRFGTLSCLLISSCLGGGLWTSTEGQKLLTYLKATYHDFYSKWPKVSFLPTEASYSYHETDKINYWLMQQANVAKQMDLLAKFPRNIEDLSSLSQSNEGQLPDLSNSRTGSCIIA